MSPFIAPEPKAPPAKHTVTPQSTHFTSMFNKSTMPQGSQRQRQGPLSMLELSSFPHYLKKQAQAEPLQWVWIWGLKRAVCVGVNRDADMGDRYCTQTLTGRHTEAAGQTMS